MKPRSQDKRYIASAKSAEADVLTVSILDARSHQRLTHAEAVNGFVWVPLHPHRLVVATCGIYGAASLVMWDGGTRWRSLRPVRQPENECFELLGVTADGRSIVYSHDPNLELESHGARLVRRHWLRLPR